VSLQIELRKDRYAAAVITVVIAAHNESRAIGPLLRKLIPAEYDNEVTVIVVASGCTDNTAQIASAFGNNVWVIDIPGGSKRLALLAGDAAAAGYPRIYVDADVEFGAPDLLALSRELAKPGVLAAVPERMLALDGCARAVRWYYDIWLRLPDVRRGMFGRGVLGVTKAGHGRLAGMPAIVAGDLAASLPFAHAERRVVAGARVVCPVPRTFLALLRYRCCVAREVSRAPAGMRRSLARQTGARPAGLLDIVSGQPGTAPAAALFLFVTACAWAAALTHGRSGRENAAGTPAGWGCPPAG
jgi:hypothetical protein